MNNSNDFAINPHYSKTFRFYYYGLIGLFCCGCYLMTNYTSLTSRWDKESIVAVHLFTLGFLLPVFLGSITQMLPVLFGIQNHQISILNKVFLILPITVAFMLYFFDHDQLEKNYFLLALLAIFWTSLSLNSFSILKNTIAKYRENKKSLFLHLLICQIYFLLGLAASVWLMAVHFGLPLPYFRPHVTNIHLTLFLVGFFYHLFVAISQHIIPMFHITAPIDEKVLHRQLFVPIALISYYLTCDSVILHSLSKIAIFYLIGAYLLQLFWNLKNRKRKNRDPGIFLWNMFFVQALVSLFLWNLILPFEIPQDPWELKLGSLIFFGLLLNLIVAMLVKIVPFLLWQDLSYKQMEKMNFQVSLPNLKDFISDKNIEILFYLILVLSISSFFLVHFLTGMLLVFLSLYLCYLFIRSLQLHQNTLIALNEN